MNREQLEADRAQHTADAAWEHIRNCPECHCHVKWFLDRPDREESIVIKPCVVAREILKHFHNSM